MKNLVKIFVMAAFAFGFGVTAQAQEREATINVGATVMDALSVTANGNLAFGIVMQGAAKRIDAAGAVTTTDSSDPSTTGATTGQFIVHAGAGSSVTLEFEVPSVLEGDGDATLPIYFNKALNGTSEADNVGYGTAGSSITRLEVDEPNSITFPSTTVNDKIGTRVYVGGTVIPSATQANGAYIGTITLTATYN